MKNNFTFLFLLALLPLASAAQWSFGNLHRRSLSRPSAPITATARTEPATTTVGAPSSFVIEVVTSPGVGVESLQVSGLPDSQDFQYLANSFETLPQSSTPSNLTHRFRLPFRALAPVSRQTVLAIRGMATVRQQSGNSSFTSSSSFTARTDPFAIAIEPLPEAGKPEDFTGAVGSSFALSQKLSATAVRPGDLLTATYVLDYSGHFPTNLTPKISALPSAFKTYPPKEISRSPSQIVWTQIIVPQTTAATNSSSLSLDWFDVRSKRYATAYAPPIPLSFTAASAASTENVAVVMNASSSSASTANPAAPIVIRFAPSSNSPVILTLPPDTPCTELDRRKNWRRVSTPRAIGWTEIKQ